MREKQCTRCHEWKLINKFHKDGKSAKGYQLYKSICAECVSKIQREKGTNRNRKHTRGEWKHKNEYSRARTRALTRLSHLVPELYDKLLQEELEKEGVHWKVRYKNSTMRSVTK